MEGSEALARACIALLSIACGAPSPRASRQPAPARIAPVAVEPAAPDAMAGATEDASAEAVAVAPEGESVVELSNIRVRVGSDGDGEAGSATDLLEMASDLRDVRDAGVALERSGGWLATDSERLACLRQYAEDGSATTSCYAVPDDAAQLRLVDASVEPDGSGWLEMLDADGAQVSATVAQRPNGIVIDSERRWPAASASPLDPPSWALPPSRRPRSRRPRVTRPRSVWRRVDTGVASAFDSHPDVQLSGLAIDAGTSLLLVSRQDALDHLLCVATRAAVSCTGTELESLVRLVSHPSEAVWLVTAETSHGNSRDNERLLVLVRREGDTIATETLSLGGVSGDGEACPDVDSYCVWLEGVGHSARIVEPGCVERVSGVAWSAVHVRVGDRWRDETRRERPACAERYRIADGRFTRAECGPALTLPACAVDESEDE